MRSSRIIFPVFLLITLITYYPSIGSGFVFDFVGWQSVFDAGSFSDILNCFGYKGNHQVLHFFFYSIYTIFHIQGLPWYLIFCSIHAFNGWLAYKWLMQVSTQWNLNIPNALISLTCILFLIHPYNAEPVIWKACIHYLLSFSAILGILLLAPRYVKEGNVKWLFISLLIYFLSLFLLEISFVTPLCISLLLLIGYFAGQENKTTISRAFILVGSMWGLLGVNLLINKATLGAWVGHYGTEAHFSLDVIGMVATEIKYLIKHLFDARYFSFATKNLIFDRILTIPEVVFFIMCVGIGLVILYFIKIKKVASHWHLALFGLGASVLYVLPVSNMFFYHLAYGMNDRYSYIPLLFLLAAVLAILSRLPKSIAMLGLGVLILINVFLQEKTIRYWQQSTEVLTGLKESYRWHDRSHVFVLNSPDNLNGIVMTSFYKITSGIDELIDYQTPRPNTGIMYDVYQFNMTGPNDGVKVEQIGPMQLKVTFNQWGNWWHRNGVGASAYENEFYKAETLEYPYQVTFNKFPEGSVIIYQDGKEWKEFVWE